MSLKVCILRISVRASRLEGGWTATLRRKGHLRVGAEMLFLLGTPDDVRVVSVDDRQ